MSDSNTIVAAAQQPSTIGMLLSHRPRVGLAGAITAVAVAALIAISGAGSSHTHSATRDTPSATATHHLVLADDRGPTVPAGVPAGTPNPTL